MIRPSVAFTYRDFDRVFEIFTSRPATQTVRRPHRDGTRTITSQAAELQHQLHYHSRTSQVYQNNAWYGILRNDDDFHIRHPESSRNNPVKPGGGPETIR